MFAGFGTPEDTNQRFKYLLAQGTTGLSTAFDMPALMGYDADHPMSRGEVGKEGVAVSTLRDFEILFDGIPLDKVTTSMTINAPAIVALCMYIAVAEKQGVPMAKLGGTIQNDMLKEFIAQKEWIVPPRPAVRIVIDMIEFCTPAHAALEHGVDQRVPHPRGRSDGGPGAGLHARRRHRLRRGVREARAWTSTTSRRASRSSGTSTTTSSRRSPSSAPRAASGPGSCGSASAPRTRVAGSSAPTRRPPACSLTAQQPYNNVVRTALQALAAVLGGTQSLHTNSLDETYALPTEEAVTIALRTQQLIAHESGVDRVVDPLGGSYFVEYLTDEMEKRALEYIRRIDEMGGIIRAVEEGYPQKEIGESAYRYQREVEQGERVIVGVNAFQSRAATRPIELLKIDERVAEEQVARLSAGEGRARTPPPSRRRWRRSRPPAAGRTTSCRRCSRR